MNNTNYFSSLVKILEKPKHFILTKQNCLTVFRAEIPQFRNSKIVSIISWGKLSKQIQSHYNINDYILIEGYIKIGNNSNKILQIKNLQQIQVTILKIYPFLLKKN